MRLPHHAYMLPEGAEVSAAARVAAMSGGVLCEVRCGRESLEVVFEGETVWVMCDTWVWAPLGGE